MHNFFFFSFRFEWKSQKCFVTVIQSGLIFSAWIFSIKAIRQKIFISKYEQKNNLLFTKKTIFNVQHYMLIFFSYLWIVREKLFSLAITTIQTFYLSDTTISFSLGARSMNFKHEFYLSCFLIYNKTVCH